MFGYKSDINKDPRPGFVRKGSLTDAARYEGRDLGGLLDRRNTGSQIWADTAYRSHKNEKKIARAGLTSKVPFPKPPGKALPVQHERAKAARSKVRSAVEHPFAEMESRMGLFVRTIGIERATAKIGMANIAFNMKRLAFWERKTANAWRGTGNPPADHQTGEGTEDPRPSEVQDQTAQLRKTGGFKVSFCLPC